jgi:choline dehydrogenase
MARSGKADWDVLIAGAGSAGAVLAARLSEDRARQVLLVEAGPHYPDLESLPAEVKYGCGTSAGIMALTHDWGLRAQAVPAGAMIEVPRGRLTGGSSAVNAQIFLRGLPEDFARWAGMGCPAWSFAQVLPWYRRIERDLDFADEWHGREGPIPVRRYGQGEWSAVQQAFFDACMQKGFAHSPDLNHPQATGAGPAPLNNERNIRWSTALAYVHPAQNRPNLQICPGTLVRRVLFERKRAVGLEVVRGGGVEELRGGEVVLCAGAVGSPQILLRSGLGPAADLERLGLGVVQDQPGMGGNLRDHPAAPMRWVLQGGRGADSRHWHQVLLRYTAAGSLQRDDMMVYAAGLPEDILLLRPTLNLEESVGRLRLSAVDPQGPPQIEFNYLSTEEDRRRLREAVRLCSALVEGGAFRGLIGQRLEPADEELASDKALDEWLQRAVTTGHHISCTCPMGEVVDQWGRVLGVEGLRVVDASIMPDCVRANINATVIAMAERLAARLRGKS